MRILWSYNVKPQHFRSFSVVLRPLRCKCGIICDQFAGPLYVLGFPQVCYKWVTIEIEFA